MSAPKTVSESNTKAGYSGAKKKQLIISSSEFNPTKFSNTEIDFNDERNKSSSQFTCYARYNYGKESNPIQNRLVFRTKPIKFSHYGIPRESQYAKTDKDRSYIKLPYDTEQESCEEIFKMFEQIDNYMIKNKDKIFTGKLEGKLSKLYDYTPIVRTPQEIVNLDDEEDEESNKKSTERPKYAKIKMNTDWETNEVKTIVFAREDGVPIKQEVKTVTEFANILTWNSTAQFVISCSKIWIGKSADKTGRRQYGVSFKIEQAEITERSSSGSLKTDFTQYAFGESAAVEDSENEEETKVVESKKTPAKEIKETKQTKESSKDTKKQTSAKKVVEESDDDSDDDDDDDSDDDVEDSEEEESEDESDEEEEVKPPPKASKSTPAKGASKPAKSSK